MALASLVDADWAAGRYRECIAWCERLLDAEQDEETVHCRILECYERLGEPLAGVIYYRRYAHALAQEEALPPRRLAALYKRLTHALQATG